VSLRNVRLLSLEGSLHGENDEPEKAPFDPEGAASHAEGDSDRD
jgi:hypothetical protein